MLSLLTNYVLDVAFGVVWWTTKKTSFAIYNGISYLIWSEEEEECKLKKEDNYILMTDFTKMLNSKNSEIDKLNKRIKQLEG